MRAQSEHSIREALRELELWSAGAQFVMTEFQDSRSAKVPIIKDWKDLFSQVGDNQALLASLKDSPYYKHFEDKYGGKQLVFATFFWREMCANGVNCFSRRSHTSISQVST